MNNCDIPRDEIVVSGNVIKDLSANYRQGMTKVRILDVVVRNKYADTPGKLAAWTSAIHVEKAPKKKKPKPPDPPIPIFPPEPGNDE